MKIKLKVSIPYDGHTLEAGEVYNAVRRTPQAQDAPKWHVMGKGAYLVPVNAHEAVEVSK